MPLDLKEFQFRIKLRFFVTTGIFIVLKDGSGLADIIQYISTKSRRVTPSAFSAELYAMIYGFHNAFVLIPVQNILGSKVSVKIYTESKSLHYSRTRLTAMSEKRLLIDLYLLREAHEDPEISEIVWIPGS